MRRRELIGLLGAVAAVSWPHSVRSQGGRRRVAIVMATYASSDSMGQFRLKQIQESLGQLGWSIGHNLEIEVRWPGADAEKIRESARELVAWQPDAIVTTSTTTTAAVQRETATLPIVFTNVSDPIGEGFVRSLAQPSGNITGFVNYEPSMSGKWLELLKEVDNRVVRAAILFNPDTAPRRGAFFIPPFERAARSFTIIPVVCPVRGDAEIKAAISTIGSEPGGGLIMMPDNYVGIHRARFIELAALYKLPSVFPYRLGPADGGLLSYGPNYSELFNPIGAYVDRILKGTRVNELAVQLPSKFELVVNLRTAKILGLNVPATLLSRTDYIIE